MESWARIYSIGIHPGARRNCMILFPDGVLATTGRSDDPACHLRIGWFLSLLKGEST